MVRCFGVGVRLISSQQALCRKCLIVHAWVRRGASVSRVHDTVPVPDARTAGRCGLTSHWPQYLQKLVGQV